MSSQQQVCNYERRSPQRTLCCSSTGGRRGGPSFHCGHALLFGLWSFGFGFLFGRKECFGFALARGRGRCLPGRVRRQHQRAKLLVHHHKKER